MKVQLGAGAILATAALVVGGVLAWRISKAGSGLLDEAQRMAADARQLVDQVAADVQSGWNNNIAAPFQRGQDYMNGVTEYTGEKAWLYGDYAYTGVDPATGVLVTDGEWYGDAVARRYEAEQRALGTAPAATSVNGAAFGIYPRP